MPIKNIFKDLLKILNKLRECKISLCYFNTFLGGQWTVETYTGPSGVSGDVTDITVVFCGSKRESNPVSLNPRNDNLFQSGKKDLFEV